MLYGIGALLSAVAPGLGVLILGNSVFEGVGTALLIPPVYILTTMAFTDLTSRARAFGVISGMGGIGAAAGPLIGGLITTAISWRAAFVFQALVVATIILLSRRIVDPAAAGPDAALRRGRSGPVGGRACSSSCSGSCRPAPTTRSWWCSSRSEPPSWSGSSSTSAPASERARSRCCPPGLFRNRTSNLGLVTQNVQWLLLMGTSFVVSVFLQTVRGYSAIKTGVIFTAATRRHPGLLARRRATRQEVRAEDADRRRASSSPLAGIGLLLGLVERPRRAPGRSRPGCC